MPLPFQPSCLPLLLGSLPHRSAIQALEASGRYAGTLLAWPQLPQRSFREQSLVQSAVGFPGLVVDGAHAQVYVDREAGMRDLGYQPAGQPELREAVAIKGPTMIRFPTGSVPPDLPAVRSFGGVDILAEDSDRSDVLLVAGTLLVALSELFLRGLEVADQPSEGRGLALVAAALLVRGG